jgi:hypothetical protein
MPAAIDPEIKKQVIAEYLHGVSRDTIAVHNGIGTGTVSNIIDEWKKGVQDSDYDFVRELAIHCKKEGVNFRFTDQELHQTVRCSRRRTC